MKSIVSSSYVIAICFLGGLVLRSTFVNQPHSGQSKPPMFGDYEAQRHWMEITLNLPVLSWYQNTTDNDLQYWGLDYPPITAYHSLIMGMAANRINSSWVELHKSRGMESYHHKVFMRYTVLVADALIFLPACIFLALHSNISRSVSGSLYILLILISYPGLVLIDHGHFQYNGISLGLFLFSVGLFHRQQDISASILFCCALGYKQMLFYFALPIFFFLLGKCLFLGMVDGMRKLVTLGLAVISTFTIIFLPFLTSVQDVSAVIMRLFPFARGLYEDKVASVWCSLSAIIKVREIFSQPELIALCTVSTLILHIPFAWLFLWRRPGNLRGLRFALSASSLAFFLFSYQVHEKSILMPAVAVILLGTEQPLLTLHFSLISTLSMWPLLLKDGLALVTISLCLFHGALALLFYPGRKPSKPAMSLVLLSVSGFVTLLGCSMFIPPPQKLPDIHALFISAYSCVHFLIYLLHCYAVLVFDIGGLLNKVKKID